MLEKRLAAGRYDLRGVGERAEIIDEAELRARFPGEPLLNVNTPEDLKKAMSFRAYRRNGVDARGDGTT